MTDVTPRIIAEVATGVRPPPRTIPAPTVRLLASAHGLAPAGLITDVRTTPTHRLRCGGQAFTIHVRYRDGRILAILADLSRTGRLLRVDPLRATSHMPGCRARRRAA